jgi:hypothetical protein
MGVKAELLQTTFLLSDIPTEAMAKTNGRQALM